MSNFAFLPNKLDGFAIRGSMLLIGTKMLMGCQIRHGAQGTFDDASKATLENEFGTTNDDEIIKQILEKGTVQETKVSVPHCIPVLIFPHILRALQQTNPFSTNREQRERALRTTAWDPVPVIRYSSLA